VWRAGERGKKRVTRRAPRGKGSFLGLRSVKGGPRVCVGGKRTLWISSFLWQTLGGAKGEERGETRLGVSGVAGRDG